MQRLGLSQTTADKTPGGFNRMTRQASLQEIRMAIETGYPVPLLYTRQIATGKENP